MNELFVNKKEVIPLERKALAIVNSWSRMGRGKIYGKRLEGLRGKILSEYGWELDIRYTQPDGEENSAFNLGVLAVKEGYQEILAVGGDGLVNSVFHGLVSVKAEIPIAILPCGVGNDLAKGLGIPRKFEEALEVAFKGRERSIDVLKIIPGRDDKNYQVVNTIASLGFDAKLVQNIPNFKRKFRRVPPLFFYLIALIKEIFLPFEYPTVTIRFSEEGEIKTITERITLIAIANGKGYAGDFFKMAPMAELDSGEFIICLVRKMAKWRIVAKLLPLYLGIHIRDKKRVMTFSVSDVEIFLPRKGIDFQIDGDSSGILEGEESCRITVLPGALRVKVCEAIVPS